MSRPSTTAGRHAARSHGSTCSSSTHQEPLALLGSVALVQSLEVVEPRDVGDPSQNAGHRRLHIRISCYRFSRTAFPSGASEVDRVCGEGHSSVFTGWPPARCKLAKFTCRCCAATHVVASSRLAGRLVIAATAADESHTQAGLRSSSRGYVASRPSWGAEA